MISEATRLAIIALGNLSMKHNEKGAALEGAKMIKEDQEVVGEHYSGCLSLESLADNAFGFANAPPGIEDELWPELYTGDHRSVSK